MPGRLSFYELDASRLDGGEDRDFPLALGVPDRGQTEPRSLRDVRLIEARHRAARRRFSAWLWRPQSPNDAALSIALRLHGLPSDRAEVVEVDPLASLRGCSYEQAICTKLRSNAKHD
jgi:hypothetical protein